jgi:hypothetical protein
MRNKIPHLVLLFQYLRHVSVVNGPGRFATM